MPTQHAVTRARDRYCLDLTMGDLIKIEDDITAGRMVLMARHKDNSHYLVMFKGTAMKAVVRRDNVIITFLPKEFRQQTRLKQGYRIPSSKGGRRRKIRDGGKKRDAK